MRFGLEGNQVFPIRCSSKCRSSHRVMHFYTDRLIFPFRKKLFTVNCIRDMIHALCSFFKLHWLFAITYSLEAPDSLSCPGKSRILQFTWFTPAIFWQNVQSFLLPKRLFSFSTPHKDFAQGFYPSCEKEGLPIDSLWCWRAGGPNLGISMLIDQGSGGTNRVDRSILCAPSLSLGVFKE